jgi:hypothetical protein
MKNRSRNNSIDFALTKSRSNSIEFNIKSNREKSTRSYSSESIESIYLEDDIWIQNIDNNNRKNNDNFINKSPTEFLYNKNNIFIQHDKKCRKRDVYSHNIGESPKPSDFVELYEIFIKKKNKTN